MKSIFTRPVFINPQAYLVIPELMLINRSTPYDFSSNQYVFQVITTGQIEGKLLQTGNEYILHLDLYSKEGNVVLGEFYLDGSYIRNADDFILEQSNGFVTITFGGGNISYPGLIAAWSAKGKSNDDEDRAILKDLTGNGHDITLNGFAFNTRGSGYINNIPILSKWLGASGGSFIVNNDKSITITSTTGNGSSSIVYTNNIYCNFKLSVKGLNSGSIYIENRSDSSKRIDIISDGIYSIPFYTGYNIRSFYKRDTCNIELSLIDNDEEESALVFDGVNDYGINEDMPVQTDFTLIVNREYINTNKGSCLISKAKVVGQGAFVMEIADSNLNTEHKVSSFNAVTNCRLYNNNISYLIPNRYNNTDISRGTANDTNTIILGTVRPNDSMSRYFNGAFYSAYLFDRSLDEQEIKAFIRKYIDPEYLLPSEQYLRLNQGKLNINKLK